MTLLDAYALIAFLVAGPGAAQVRALLREGGLGIATANLAEALDVTQRVHGVPVGRATELIDPLMPTALSPLPLDAARARRAAEIRARHYHRASRPISLADAILIGSAARGDRIVTADPHVLAIAAAEGLATVALPVTASSGP